MPVFASCILILCQINNKGLLSSWRTGPLSIMKCPSLTLIIFLAQNSALFEINIATSTFFWLVLARHVFLLSPIFNFNVSLYFKWDSCRQHTVGSCFFIHWLYSFNWYIETNYFWHDYWYYWIHIYHVGTFLAVQGLILHLPAGVPVWSLGGS